MKNNLKNNRIITYSRLLIFFSINFYLLSININCGTKFNHINANSGLSQNYGTAILQDHTGFIWIGTQDGLNRFDGYDFDIFYSGDNNQLSSNYILSMIVDKENSLWIGTQYGLNKYDSQSQKITQYILDKDSLSIAPNNFIYSIVNDGNSLWLATDAGLNRFNKTTGDFDLYAIPQSLRYSNNSSISVIIKFSKNTLLIGTKGNGLLLFDIINNKFFKTEIHINNYQDELQYIYDIKISKYIKDNILIASNKGVYLFNESTHICKKLSPDSEYGITTKILEDDKKQIWIGTLENGLFVTDLNGKLTNHYKNQGDKNSISSQRISELFLDNQNHLWIGTNTGVDIHTTSELLFTAHRNNYNKLAPNGINNVFPIMQDSKNNLWIGTDNGVIKKNKFGEILKHYRNIPGRKNSLKNNLIRSIIETKDGKIWIANYDGVDILDPITGKFSEPKNMARYGKVKVINLFQDRNEIIWASSDGNGLFKIDPRKGVLKNYCYDPENPKSNPNNHSIQIIECDKDNLFLATYYSGVIKFNPSTEEFSPIRTNVDSLSDFNGCSVMSMYLDDKNILWIGSYGNGLFRYNVVKNHLSKYSVDDGLANNVIYGIVEDKKNNLWISTNRGISRFNKNTKTFRNFTTQDGLQSNEFNGMGYFRDRGGKIYFGGLNGYVSFDPEKISTIKRLPPVVFTNFQLFGKPVPINEEFNGRIILKKSIESTREIDLTYDDYSFSIEYASLNYIDPDKIKYKYRMINFDKDWTLAGNRRFVTYNLPPGNYIFEVTSTNVSGTWQNKISRLKINVSPPFWDTILFKVFITLFVILSIYLFYLYRITSIKKQKIWLEENNQKLNEEINRRIRSEKEIELLNSMLIEKNKELEQIIYVSSHDLRTPLVNIQGYSKELSDFFENLCDQINATGSKSEMYEYLNYIKSNTEKMASLINGLLEYSRITRDKVVFEKINVNDIIENILKLSESKIEELDITIKSSSLPPCYGNKKQITNVFTNIIKNSMMYYSPDRKIHIEISGKIKENFVVYKIIDNGIGIDKNYQKKIFDIFHRLDPDIGSGVGIGLAVTNKILKNHFGNISLKSEPGQGTEVKITLPAENPDNITHN